MSVTPTYKAIVKSLVCGLIILMAETSSAQNLVTNGDFENYSSLPDSYGQWDRCVGWLNPNTASPDYFHVNSPSAVQLPSNIFGQVNPFSGSAIMGMVTEYPLEFREYLSTRLATAMVPGATYTVSYWMTNGTGGYYGGYSSNHIGILFSTTTHFQNNYQNVPLTPQIDILTEVWSTTWEQHVFTFVADSAYQYFTMGNFYDNPHTLSSYHAPSMVNAAYYFIDKIEVIRTTSPPIPPGSVTVAFQMPNLITPNNDGDNDLFVPIVSSGIAEVNTKIYNRWGSQVYSSNDLQVNWKGEDVSDGVYFWVITYTDVYRKEKTINGIVSVLK